MERPEIRRHVDDYAILARYYDALLQDEESLRTYWLPHITKCPGKKVLELASGSGVMAKILQTSGYDIIASDLSQSMKEAALRNAFTGPYLIMDMADFNLDDTFDIILCLCDSINYLPVERLEKMFRNVHDHLNKGGTFLFDMHDVKRIEEFKDAYIEEGTVLGDPYQWSIQSDVEDMCLYETFVFYTKEGIIQEDHRQYVYPPETMIKLLKSAGFTVTIDEHFVPNEKVLLEGVKL